MQNRFSAFIIGALVDAITGGAGNDQSPSIGIYRSGPKIEQFFLDCGLDMRIGPSSRVPAATAAIREAMRQPDGDKAIERLIQKVCDPREYLSEPDKAVAVRDRLNSALEPDGLSVMGVSAASRGLTPA